MNGLKRWALFVGIYFYMGFCVIFIFGLFVLGPALDWYVNRMAYTLPTLHRSLQTATMVLVLATVVGSYSWMRDRMAEKRSRC